MKTVDLSIRLLRVGFNSASALKPGHGLSPHVCSVGDLFYEKSVSNPPPWSDFLEPSAAGIKNLLATQHSSAVLFVQTSDGSVPRFFAICFGQGHHAVDSEAIERQFGLRVVLNSLARNGLRTLDSAALDSTVMQRRTQASRESDLRDFGIDTQRELLRLASGKPTDTSFAKALTGKDALQVRRPLGINDLADFCADCLKKYRDNAYVQDFSFIDQVKPIENKTLVGLLDNLLYEQLLILVGGGSSELHLAVPDVVGPKDAYEVSYFGAELRGGAKVRYTRVAIEDYVEELKTGTFSASSDMANIRRSHELKSASSDGGVSEKRRVYDCMVYEVMHAGEQYVIFDGQWFAINHSYYHSINKAYNLLVKASFLPTTTMVNERALIASLIGDPNLLCMDQTKSSPKGARGRILRFVIFWREMED